MTQDEEHIDPHGECDAEIKHLQSQLSVSEKCAEEAEARANKLQVDYCLALGKEEVAHDNELTTALVIANNYQSLMVTAQREAGGMRSVVDAARKLEAGGVLCGENWAALRSALHRSQGEG